MASALDLLGPGILRGVDQFGSSLVQGLMQRDQMRKAEQQRRDDIARQERSQAAALARRQREQFLDLVHRHEAQNAKAPAGGASAARSGRGGSAGSPVDTEQYAAAIADVRRTLAEQSLDPNLSRQVPADSTLGKSPYDMALEEALREGSGLSSSIIDRLATNQLQPPPVEAQSIGDLEQLRRQQTAMREQQNSALARDAGLLALPQDLLAQYLQNQQPTPVHGSPAFGVVQPSPQSVDTQPAAFPPPEQAMAQAMARQAPPPATAQPTAPPEDALLQEILARVGQPNFEDPLATVLPGDEEIAAMQFAPAASGLNRVLAPGYVPGLDRPPGGGLFDGLNQLQERPGELQALTQALLGR